MDWPAPVSRNQDELNSMNPAARDAALGDCVNDLITNYNALQAFCVGLQTKYAALLAHIDAGNVAGIGNGNTAAYGVASPTATQITDLSDR